jgi:UPF0755 protein
MQEPSPRRADRHRETRRSGRGKLLAALCAFLLLVVGLSSLALYYQHCQGGGADGQPVTITVSEGASGAQVVDQLATNRVIRCGGLAGRVMMHQQGKAGDIKAGTYQLTTGMTLSQAMMVLTAPPVQVATTTVLIPEGYRLTQIASTFEQKLRIPAKRFMDATAGGSFSVPGFVPAGRSLEGFLFPDTYQFATQGTTAEAVIKDMLNQFEIQAKSLPFSRAAALGVTPYQVVVIASMIEREARVQGDRAKIAAVIYNRLKKGMTLGIDATILYADPTPDGKLSSYDLAFDTPYNTRIHTGLPPTPIASPGLASLMAALHPAHVNYLYYVLCGADGHHKFSRNNSQFQKDKAHCLG